MNSISDFEYASTIIDYNPLDGVLKRIGENVEAGTLRKDGYRQIQIGKKFFLSHRLAWFIQHKEMPEFIDHQNGNKIDNRIINLRNVSQHENNKNMPIQKSNRSGFVGVILFKPTGNWMSYIDVNKKRVHLGYYKNLSDAVKSRVDAEQEHGFHTNHGREQ